MTITGTYCCVCGDPFRLDDNPWQDKCPDCLAEEERHEQEQEKEE